MGEELYPMNEHDMRGNMSITKSIVDYYHSYKHNIGEDDLMSLCRNNQQFIYVICKFHFDYLT